MENRVQYLKNRFVQARRHVDTKRAELLTESYKASEGKPEIIRRALALQHILANADISIHDGELIVGNHTKNVRGTPLCPEYATDWLSTQMDDFMTRPGDKFDITEEQKQTVYGCLEYWKGKSLRDRVMANIPQHLKEKLDTNVIYNSNYTMSAPGHMNPYYEYLLQTGFEGVIARCQTLKAALPSDATDKAVFYDACMISCQAMIDFAQRYVALATELAETEADAQRKEELLAIAKACANVPAKPAATYYEALQFIFFVQLGIQTEGNGIAISIGRLDYYMNKYYTADVDAGILTRDSALELLECFYIKIGELDKIYSNEAVKALQGPGHGQTITVGGVDADGNDITNDISYMVLEADREVGLVQPDIALRIHQGTPVELLKAATYNVKTGINKVKIFNDSVVVAGMKIIDALDEDKWNFSFLGCSEPIVDGKTNSWGNSGHVNFAKCLELALNDGKCMITGQQMGVATGDPTQFTSIEDVKQAYMKQTEYFVAGIAEFDRWLDQYQAEFAPLPLYSSVIWDCIGSATEFNAGGARYNTTSPLGVGPITTGDSLMAIEKLVFQDKRLTMAELLELLKTDFAGHEDLRMMMMNRAPKYGNDIDEADAMSGFVAANYCDELDKHKNLRNGPFVAGLYYLTANIPNGARTAATADGRHAGEPLNDGGISPTHGADKCGGTAVLKSAGKLCNDRIVHGCVLNQLFHPSVFAGEQADDMFAAYMRSILQTGTFESQFNVISPDTLIDAQENPDEYKSLVVRVAGYSAYFTALEPDAQNDIIDRTLLTQC